MYTTQDTEKNPVRLFQLPNTLAGDAAVTIILQCIVTWIIELILIQLDLKNGRVQPIGFIPEPSNRLLRWFMFLKNGETDPKQPPGRVRRLGFVFAQVVRGFIFAAFSIILLWPPTVGILTTVGDKRGSDYFYGSKWVPQFYKLILGGVLGLLSTPLMVMFWLVKAGWSSRA
jgi:hypothetical protein